MIAAAAVGGLLAGVTPAQAGPLPPACDPTVSGPGIPACPSVLVGEVGDIERPTIALPDLVPDVSEVFVNYETIDLDPETGEWIFGRPWLNFDTLARNEGAVPLEVRAEEVRSLDGSAVSQCISWTTNLLCRRRARVGGLMWHGEHLHYHFEGFAAYELRRVVDGAVDFSDKGLVVSSPKVSFCLVDSRQIRADAVPVPRYNSCSLAEEGISPGWADVYPAGIDGQMMPLDNVDDGVYALVIALNVENRVFETSTANNRVVVMVELAGLGTFFPVAGITEKHRS